jgi:hypothetical protein
MNFPIILDVAIGIVVVYFISSLIMSFVMEYIIVRRNWRGDFLYDKLSEMFYSSQGGYYNIIEKIYRHPLITKAQQYSYRRPEKIPSHTFANAFMHVMTEIGQETQRLDLLANTETETLHTDGKVTERRPVLSQNDYFDLAVDNTKYLDGDGKRIIDSLFLYPPMNTTKNIDDNTLSWRTANIEQWYDDFHLRLDYLFKREVKWYIFVFSLVLCSLLNIDTLGIYDKLMSSATLRDRMVMLGEEYANETFDTIKLKKEKIMEKTMADITASIMSRDTALVLGDSAKLNEVVTQAVAKSFSKINHAKADIYEGANDLVGWTKIEREKIRNAFAHFSDHWSYWIYKIIGILVSSFALMFGAPFWHEYLKSMLAIRKVIQPKGMIK